MTRLIDERELLMIPGPTNIDPRVLRASSKAPLSHTGAAFGKIFKEAIEDMKKIFMTEDQVFIVCGSGTLAQEMGVANFVERGDKVLVASNGFFSERFVEICKRHGANVSKMEIEWGKVATPQMVRERLEKDDYKAFFAVHVETSTGAAHNVKELGRVVHDFGTLFVLDTVCSLGGMEIRTTDWNIDVCLTGSQKALAIPTGLALLAVSQKAMEAYKRRKQLPDFYYGDLANWIPVMEDPTKYFATPPTSLIYSLNESTKMILEEGLESRFRRHRIIAEAFRAMLKAHNLKLVADEEFAADTMSGVRYPQGVDDKTFRALLANEFGITVAGGLGPLAGKIFRVGHLGNVTPNDILATIGVIEIALDKNGAKIDLGKGITAAQKALTL